MTTTAPRSPGSYLGNRRPTVDAAPADNVPATRTSPGLAPSRVTRFDLSKRRGRNGYFRFGDLGRFGS